MNTDRCTFFSISGELKSFLVKSFFSLFPSCDTGRAPSARSYDRITSDGPPQLMEEEQMGVRDGSAALSYAFTKIKQVSNPLKKTFS